MSNTSKTKTAVKTQGKRVKTETEVAVTKTKFTPTPWRLDDYGYGYKIEPDICWLGENGRTTKEQLKANANLLFAAPEMYEMLKSLEIVLRNSGVVVLSEQIESVLRKARGESEIEK